MRRTSLKLAGAALALVSSVAPALCKSVLLLTGLFGIAFAPMTDVKDALEADGHTVTYTPWFAPPFLAKFDAVVGHSKGADTATTLLGIPLVITIDPTVGNVGCPSGSRCINYYAPADTPVGGSPVRGATNIKVQAGHVEMPSRVLSRIRADLR